MNTTTSIFVHVSLLTSQPRLTEVALWDIIQVRIPITYIKIWRSINHTIKLRLFFVSCYTFIWKKERLIMIIIYTALTNVTAHVVYLWIHLKGNSKTLLAVVALHTEDCQVQVIFISFIHYFFVLQMFTWSSNSGFYSHEESRSHTANMRNTQPLLNVCTPS